MEDSQDFILLFNAPMDTRKNFFKTHKQFGHALSKKFACPGLVSSLRKCSWPCNNEFPRN